MTGRLSPHAADCDIPRASYFLCTEMVALQLVAVVSVPVPFRHSLRTALRFRSEALSATSSNLPVTCSLPLRRDDNSTPCKHTFHRFFEKIMQGITPASPTYGPSHSHAPQRSFPSLTYMALCARRNFIFFAPPFWRVPFFAPVSKPPPPPNLPVNCRSSVHCPHYFIKTARSDG